MNSLLQSLFLLVIFGSPFCFSMTPDITPNNISTPDQSPIEQFLNAAETGSISKMRTLLAQDPTLINRKGNFGWTALHCASSQCYKQNIPATIAFLLKSGANVHETTNNGNYTALHLAAMTEEINNEVIRDSAQENAQIATLSLLMLHGSHPSAQNEYGDTVLHMQALYGNTCCTIPFFVAWGTNPVLKNKDHQTVNDIWSFSEQDAEEKILQEALKGQIDMPIRGTIINGIKTALSLLDLQDIQAIASAIKVKCDQGSLWGSIMAEALLNLAQEKQQLFLLSQYILNQYTQGSQSIFQQCTKELIDDLTHFERVIHGTPSKILSRKFAVAHKANKALSQRTGYSYCPITGKRKRNDH